MHVANDRPSVAQWVKRWMTAGLAAACTLLILDALQTRLTFGTWVLPGPRLVLSTLGVGLIAGLIGDVLLVSWSRLRGGPTSTKLVESFALAFALLYGLAAFFRFERVALLRGFGIWAPPLATLLAWAGTLFILQRVGAAAGRGWLGSFVAGLFWSLFLIGNREFVGSPTSPAALGFDAGVSILAVLVVLLLRSWRGGDTTQDRVALIGAGLLMILLATAASNYVSRQQVLNRQTAAAVSKSRTESTPHVVLVVFDTMRGDVFEDVLKNTQEGRAFAEAAGPITWFDRAIAAGPWTPPSMSTILTGAHPLQHGVRADWKDRLANEQTTLGRHLLSAGYQTMALVANRALEQSIGVDRGFQIYEGLPTETDLAVLGRVARLLFSSGETAPPHRAWFVDAERARKVLEDRLELVDPELPVFLWYHLMDTHGPLKRHTHLRETPGDAGLTTTQLDYRNNARFALAETALALDAIHERLSAEETLLIVLADHGEMFPADGQAAPGRAPDDTRDSGHGHAYFDTLVRIPLGVRLPASQQDRPQRARSHRLVSHLDIVPTVMDALEETWPEPLLGCSLGPLIVSTAPDEPEHCHPFVVSEGTSDRHGALRTGRLKLMASPTDAFEPLLFDLEADPHEQDDRAHRDPEVAAAALELLRRYWETHTSDRTTPAGDLTPAQIETLRALGYL